VTNSLAKPAPYLICETYTGFTFTPPAYWNGTVDFGGGAIYGLTFTSNEPPMVRGQSSHFEEEFVIYKLGKEWDDPDFVYLKGWNTGVVSNANNKFRANGEITEAYGPFDGWLGRKVHISGIVTNLPDGSMPESASGTFRIN
jgi:hypothetical protein